VIHRRTDDQLRSAVRTVHREIFELGFPRLHA
jgi:hypothetical protein